MKRESSRLLFTNKRITTLLAFMGREFFSSLSFPQPVVARRAAGHCSVGKPGRPQGLCIVYTVLSPVGG